MTTTKLDPRLDRLYKLIPAIYRIRDVQQGYPLQALLRVIAEQVNVVEDNIGQLYDNWFIETAEDWAVPYIADLIGYNPVLAAGPESDDATSEGRALNRILIPRREVANTIGNRRRKGTLALLDQLSTQVAGWQYALAIEFFKRLAWNQNIDHLHLARGRTVDLRHVEDLDLIDGPFDRFAHTVDIRRVDSSRTVGRYNIQSVGVFVWRLNSYSVTNSPACCAEDPGPNCFTFSVLGQDAPLFVDPTPPAKRTLLAEELSVPSTIRRFAFDKYPDHFYGSGKSMVIYADGWTGLAPDQPVPLKAIVPADLSMWQYVPLLNQVAVDPVLGRFAFPPNQLPKKGVRVSYHYGFSADIGGGEYQRPIFDPTSRKPGEPIIYSVGKGQRIADAITKWATDKPLDAVIEITDSSVYVEAISLALGPSQTLQLRAANAKRPVIRLLDYQTDRPDALAVSMSEGSRFTLDGVMVTGRPLQITGPDRTKEDAAAPPVCGSEIVIRHCTLVPGWGIDCDCKPDHPAEPSIELFNVRATLRIEHSIVGSIEINEDEVAIDPIPVRISDTILDGMDLKKEVIGAPGMAVAHAVLCFERCTVVGIVNVRAIETAQDSIFCGCLNVARRQLGCMRFCYVPPGCRTPRRYHCQPDLVTQAAIAAFPNAADQAKAIASEQLRVRPQFTSTHYGTPGYAQLGRHCADEIKRGAEDESEMGVFHDLFQPQREANLNARLEEYTPAGMDVGILFVN